MNVRPWIAFRWVIVASVLAAAAATVPAQDVWRSQGPPNLGAVGGVTIADTIAYAATGNGVFRSDDGGVTWRQSGLEGVAIRLVEAQAGADLVFATTQEGELYGSRDGGESWARILEQLSLVRDVAIDPRSPSTVYVGSSDGKILKSTDSGSSWQELSTLPHDIREFALSRDAILLLGFSELLRSVDGGRTWENVISPLRYASVVAVGEAPDVVYLGGDLALCKSTDAAATWTCAELPSYPLSILEVPGDGAGTPPDLFVYSGQGLLRSLDGGTTWEPVSGAGATSLQLSNPATDSSGSLLLAGGNGGVFRSTSRGDSWDFSSAGLVASHVSALAVDPTNSSTLWACVQASGQGPGLTASIDGGTTWLPVDATPDPIWVGSILIDPRNSSRMYAHMYVDPSSGIYRSEDAGRTWSASPSADEVLQFLALDPHDSDTLWKLSSGTLYRSGDGARSFTAVSTLAQDVYSLVFDGRRPGTIYAGSYSELVDGWYGPYPEGGSLFVSRDAGATWTRNAVEFATPVSAIATDPFADGTLYVGTYERVYRSLDDGASWTLSDVVQPSAAVNRIVADPVRSGHLYAATDSGVFRSTDRAATWLPFTTGLPLALSVTSLVITPDGKRLHVGTSGAGIYKRDLEGSSKCYPSKNRLCLVGARYAVDLYAGRRGEPPTTPGVARALSDRGGYFSLPFATGDSSLPEVVVKILGHGALGLDGAPVFYSSLTTLPYRMIVTDTSTGETKTYDSDAAHPLCGAVDVAFEPEAAASILRAGADSANALSLLHGRFSVTLEARRSSTGASSAGRAIAISDRSGFFTLPGFTSDPTLPEVIVKMLDFRWIDGGFAVFYTGLTHLDYTLTVTDSVTEAVRTYESPGDFCGEVETLSPN